MWVGGNGTGELDGTLRAGADTVHPGIDLDVDREGSQTVSPSRTERTGPLEGLQQRGQPAFGVNGRRQPVLYHQLHGLSWRLGKDEDRDVYACFTQLAPLLGQRHAQVGGPAGHGRGRHRYGTVPVAVGLHHRADDRRSHRSSDLLYVGRHRGQVHLHPGRPEPPGDADRVLRAAGPAMCSLAAPLPPAFPLPPGLWTASAVPNDEPGSKEPGSKEPGGVRPTATALLYVGPSWLIS